MNSSDGTSNNVSIACNPDEDWSCPTPGLQVTYWATAAVFSGVGLFMIGYTYREYKRNDAMKLPMVQVFYPMLFGDFLFSLMYFPYHLYNIILAIQVTAAGGSLVNLVEDSPFCKVSWFVVSIAVMFQLSGQVVISYAPYRIIQNSKKYIQNGKIISSRVYKLEALAAVVLGLMWFVSGIATDHVGNFAGIYCAANSWQNEQGVILFTTIFVSFGILSCFFISAYWQLKKQHGTTSGNDETSAVYRKTSLSAARVVLKFGLLMLGSLLFCYGVFAITAFMNATNAYNIPFEWEMASGLMLKLKSIIDTTIVLNLPVVKRARNKSRVAETTTLTNEFKSFNDNTSIFQNNNDDDDMSGSFNNYLSASNSNFSISRPQKLSKSSDTFGGSDSKLSSRKIPPEEEVYL